MGEPAPTTSPGSHRRLTTPTRETLLANYAQTEALCKIILALEALAGLGALAWISARGQIPPGPVPWIALGFGALGVFRWFFHHVFLNKKRIEHIRRDAQFGVHTRDSLVNLASNVFDRLGLRRDAAPVFLIRDKDINAHAIRCELWPGLHLFNGVFLNRSIIHLLDEPELASVIGHELGHVFPYSPLLSRAYAVHSAFAGLVCFAIACTFPHAAIAVVAPVAVLWMLDWVIAFPHMRLSRGMEFLCDDHGARASGLLPALSSEIKIAAEQEARQQLLLRVFESREAGNTFNMHDLAEAYEKAVPFGKSDPEAFQREFQKLTETRQQSARQVSIGGFLEHLGGGNDNVEESASEQISELKQLEALPLISVPREPYLQGSGAWTHTAAARLIAAIENEPDRLLVRLTNEIVDHDVTHPGPSRRMLFLWRNRDAYSER
jgi:Zn-dependent protease with chaperone function